MTCGEASRAQCVAGPSGCSESVTTSPDCSGQMEKEVSTTAHSSDWSFRTKYCRSLPRSRSSLVSRPSSAKRSNSAETSFCSYPVAFRASVMKKLASSRLRIQRSRGSLILRPNSRRLATSRSTTGEFLPTTFRKTLSDYFIVLGASYEPALRVHALPVDTPGWAG